MCNYKLDTRSDGNLMLIRMYKLPFLQTNMDELKKAINTEIVLPAYNNSICHKWDICHTAIFNKGIEY